MSFISQGPISLLELIQEALVLLPQAHCDTQALLTAAVKGAAIPDNYSEREQSLCQAF